MFRRLHSGVLRQQANAAANNITDLSASKLAAIKSQSKNTSPVIYLPNKYISLNISSIINPTNVVEFYVPLEMTKPELKRYLECYYKIDGIESISTNILQGRKKKDMRTGRWKKKEADVKKAKVHLSQQVQVDFPEEIKKEIMRFKDRRLEKQILQERRTKAMEEASERMKQEEAKKLEASLDAEMSTNKKE